MDALRLFFFIILAMIVIASCNTASHQGRWDQAGSPAVQVQVLVTDG